MASKHVSSNYVHYPKRITPDKPVVLGSSRLKWYDIATADTPVDPQVKAVAYDFLVRRSALAEWPLDDDAGFLILHRCGQEFYFLIIGTWRGNNELWESVYFKPDAATLDFALFPQGTHKGTFCVWEAGVVLHEVAAWSRYLRSARGEAAYEAYLTDAVAGEAV